EEENKSLRETLAQERMRYEEIFTRQDKSARTIGNLNEQIIALESQNRVLEDKLSNLSREREQAAKSPGVQTQEDSEKLSLLSLERDRLKEDLRRQTALTESLQARLDNTPSVDQGVLARLNDRIDSLIAENKRLQADYDSQVRRTAAMQSEMVRKADDSEHLATIQGLNDRIGVLESDNKTLREAASAQTTQIALLKAQMVAEADKSQELAKIQDLEKQLQVLTSGNAGLQSRYHAQESEITRLKTALASKSDNSADLATIADLNERLQALEKDNAALRTVFAEKDRQIGNLNASLLKARQASESDLSSLMKEKTALQSDLDTKTQRLVALERALLDQKNTLSAQTSEKTEALSRDLLAARETNARMTTKIQTLENENKRLATAVAQRPSAAPMPDQPEKIATLLARIDGLEAQNGRLMAQIEDIASPAAGEISQNNVDQSVALLSKLRAAESELASVSGERDRLSAQLDSLRENSADGRVSVATNDWDLEEATRRFNEAEREINRLGAQLEDERAHWQREKKELEYMLFDPEIAEKSQIVKLLSLEEELEETKLALADARTKPSPAPVMVQTGTGEPPRQNEGGIGGTGRAVPRPAHSLAPARLANDLSTMAPAAGTPTNRAYASGDVVRQALPTASTTLPKPAHNSGLSTLLSQAGIKPSGPLEQVAAPKQGNLGTYSWDSGSLYGSAEQKALKDRKQFDTYVNDYLKKTEGRCSGSFAAVPAQSSETEAMRVSSYEIACLSGSDEAAASLVFYDQDGVFTAIAHESDIAHMDTAMDARDRLVRVLTTASR
ncbi:MAG: hypothetical protein KDJ15_02075, partial [Alphaproteobacteria bacterium]|nr:hypothetical protein [Alphaproteobacteria bacterium]